MKTMKCDICDKEFSGETFEAWFKQMQSHYQADHIEFMKQSQGKSKEEGMNWVADMKAKFESL